MTQQTPSSGAVPSHLNPDDAPLVVVGRALAERGHYGFVWIDESLTVTATYGRLIQFVTVGEPLTNELPALVGVENDILALKARDGAVLEMPAVAIVSETAATPRLNLLLMWVGEQNCYLCLVTKTGIGSELEIELAQEIRRRLIAEADVKAKSRELSRANQDLEDYASVISHDLKAPMRALRYQVDDLENALGAALSEDVVAQLGHMRRQAKRMENMLSALLEYSSIGRKTDALSEVVTKDLVHAVIASVNPTSDHRINVTGTWPTLRTLEQPLDLVLRNLIGNAIKHNSGHEVAIRVHGETDKDHLTISVRDNGPGISLEHRRAIFLPFRTLSQNKGEDVHGLGLAIVHRIITSVGGHVEVNDRQDGRSGTVFRVMWPRTILD